MKINSSVGLSKKINNMIKNSTVKNSTVKIAL